MRLRRVFEEIVEICQTEPKQDIYPGLQFQFIDEDGSAVFNHTNPEELAKLVVCGLGNTEYVARGYRYADGSRAKFINCRQCWEFKDTSRAMIAKIYLR